MSEYCYIRSRVDGLYWKAEGEGRTADLKKACAYPQELAIRQQQKYFATLTTELIPIKIQQDDE